jgi:hypothetical protein
MPSRFVRWTAGALMALAVAAPASGQGKSGNNRGKKPTAPPSTSALPSSSTTSGTAHIAGEIDPVTIASPFAWMDDASLMETGSVWLGVSMLRWHGSGTSETIVPVVDAAVGVAPQIQFGASVPRVAGGFGTSFFSAKIGVLTDEARGVQVAIAPTLEISGAATNALPDGEGRTRWGLPISLHVDRETTRIYGSSGYFSPGIWYAGAGVARSIGNRAGVSTSFSRAWTASPSGAAVPPDALPRRNEISGGFSYDVRPAISVFAAVGRTLGMPAEEGGGTTLSFGLSLTASPGMLTK